MGVGADEEAGYITGDERARRISRGVSETVRKRGKGGGHRMTRFLGAAGAVAANIRLGGVETTISSYQVKPVG